MVEWWENNRELDKEAVRKEWSIFLTKVLPDLIFTVKNKKLMEIINIKNNDILKKINLPKQYESNKIIDYALLENNKIILKLDNFELMELNLKNFTIKSYLFTPKVIPKVIPKIKSKSKEEKYDEIASILNDNLSNEKKIKKLELIINGL